MFGVIRDFYSNKKAGVLIGQNLFPEFDTLSVVLQGSRLGPILFLIFINDLLEKLNKSNLDSTLDNLIISSLGFAEDIVLISDTSP